MASKNYYAVKSGKKVGIFTSWEEAKKYVSGYKGALYKGFVTLEEAKAYLSSSSSSSASKDKEKINKEVDKEILKIKEDEAIAFTDGSFDKKNNVSSFGAIIFTLEGRKELSASFTNKTSEELLLTRNVGSELEGVKAAINYAIKVGKKKIKIFYDYQGIEAWAKSDWMAKNPISISYSNFIKDKSNFIDIEFQKVTSHTGINFNEEVDRLAKEALKKDENGIYFDI